MAVYKYPDLTIINEDSDVRKRIAELEDAILAIHPKHEPTRASILDVQAAIQRQHRGVIDIHDISSIGSDFLLKVRHAPTYNRLLTIGYLNMSPACLVLAPWDAKHGCTIVPAHTQQRSEFGCGYNDAAHELKPPRQFRIQIAGIPPQLCRHQTIYSLLGRPCRIRDIAFHPENHTYVITGETYYFQVIPPAVHLGLKSVQSNQAILQIWPIWYTPAVHIVDEEIHQWYVEDTEPHNQGSQTSVLTDANKVVSQDAAPADNLGTQQASCTEETTSGT